jgi:hypothetical protein
MAIDANTDTAAKLGQSMGMHMPTNLPKSPSGGDTKSAQISTALNAFLGSAQT